MCRTDGLPCGSKGRGHIAVTEQDAITGNMRPACARLDRFRTLNWWRDQQGQIQGTRHPGRFFPRLMNQERALEAAAGGDWRVVAEDKGYWHQHMSVWIQQQDLPWASLEQTALEM